MELMRKLDWLERVLPSARVTLKFAPTDNSALGNRQRINEDRVRAVVAAAARRVAVSVRSNSLTAEPIDLGPLGSLVIQHDEQLGQLQFDATSPQNIREGFLRIRRSILNKAVQQIKDSGLTGIILLDLEDDRVGSDGYELLAHWIKTKDVLGAIIMIERHTLAGRACNGVHVVPGPRFDEIAEAISHGLDCCPTGHVHYAPLSTLANPCLATWLPTYSVA
jgi:hypothetical protein